MNKQFVKEVQKMEKDLLDKLWLILLCGSTTNWQSRTTMSSLFKEQRQKSLRMGFLFWHMTLQEPLKWHAHSLRKFIYSLPPSSLLCKAFITFFFFFFHAMSKLNESKFCLVTNVKTESSSLGLIKFRLGNIYIRWPALELNQDIYKYFLILYLIFFIFLFCCMFKKILSCTYYLNVPHLNEIIFA